MAILYILLYVCMIQWQTQQYVFHCLVLKAILLEVKVSTPLEASIAVKLPQQGIAAADVDTYFLVNTSGDCIFFLK